MTYSDKKLLAIHAAGYEEACRDMLEKLEIMTANKTCPKNQLEYLTERLNTTLLQHNWYRHKNNLSIYTSTDKKEEE